MSILFEPVNIGNIEMRNRFMRSATYDALADKKGFIGEKSVTLMRNLADNHVGLIITGHAYVQENGQCSIDQNGIYTDDHIPGYRKMTQAVHNAGGKIAMQIAHGGIASRYMDESGGDLVAVSVPKDPSSFKTPPRQMTEEDIETIIASFGLAARRVREAGFDGVQIHGAHGYLFSQFLSPRINHREDKWGGSLKNRMRFVVETTRSIRKEAGEDFPLMIKLGCRDYMKRPEYLTIEEGAQVVKALEKEGMCHIEISHGTLDRANQKLSSGITRPDQEAYLLPDAQKIRKVTHMPLGMVGGLRSLAVMEKIVTSGTVDTVSLCRPLIREPDLIKQWEKGSTKSADCISCGQCSDPKLRKGHLQCQQTAHPKRKKE